MSNITNVITLKQYANEHGLCVKRLRRIARKHDWPNDVKPFKFGGDDGIWAIDANAPMVTLPAKSARGTRRPDGRQRYIVFANETELVTIAGFVGDDNIVNPRIAAKSRRDARKTAIAQSEHDAMENELLADARENDNNG